MPSGIVTEEVLENIEKAKQPLVKIYHYHTNHLGTPQELSDESGNIIWLSYDRAWGGSFDSLYRQQFVDNWAVSENELQSFKFQGQCLDTETGLHYNRFRYYDSDVGMFISRDPIGLLGGSNVFQYAPNPVGWIDPWGLSGSDVTTFYHAGGDLSNVNIDPSRGRQNLEFNPKGQGGFYVTTDLAQAQRWQRRNNSPAITRFDVPNSELQALDHKVFEHSNAEWEEFVTKGRTGSLSHNHDIVSGQMVANPREVKGGKKPIPIGQQTAIFSDKAAKLFDKCKVS